LEPSDTAGVEAAAPVPVSKTICGLLESLSEIVSVPVLAPVVVGVKVTLMSQLAPAPTEVPHVFVWAKSPLGVMLVMAKAEDPLLVSVTVCAVLVVLTLWVPKVRLVGKTVIPEDGTSEIFKT
jgi:hypothetical protein